MIKLMDALEGIERLGIDTPAIIYFVEADLRYDQIVTEIFRRIAEGELFGVTSVISVTEVLTQPILKGDEELQKRYRDLLIYSRGFYTVDIDAGMAEFAAHLRSRYHLRTPDALQLSAAVGLGCEAFLTNDMRLKRVTELKVMVLKELEL